jgi:hypothetical protein
MRIDPLQHGWMIAPQTQAVMAALGEAWFVGGPRRARRPFPSVAGCERSTGPSARGKTKKRHRHAH